MTTKTKLAKKHIERLTRMIAAHDKLEAWYQRMYGDAQPGSVRAASNVDAASLRATMVFLKGFLI